LVASPFFCQIFFTDSCKVLLSLGSPQTVPGFTLGTLQVVDCPTSTCYLTALLVTGVNHHNMMVLELPTSVCWYDFGFFCLQIFYRDK